MKILNIYIDTSIIGGCFDDEFKEVSNLIINEIKRGKFTAVISQVTLDELKSAPDNVKSVLNNLPKNKVMYLPITEEAIELANDYINENVLTEKMFSDALHIAIATVNKVDVIISWNFKHIVNLNRIRGFNAVNLLNGYSTIEIRSPMEVLYE